MSWSGYILLIIVFQSSFGKIEYYVLNDLKKWTNSYKNSFWLWSKLYNNKLKVFNGDSFNSIFSQNIICLNSNSNETILGLYYLSSYSLITSIQELFLKIP